MKHTLEILGIICDKTGFRFTGQPHPENCREHHIRLVNESDVDRILSTYRAIGTPEEIRAVIEEVEKTVEVLRKRIKLKVDAGGDVIIEHCLSEALKKLTQNQES